MSLLLASWLAAGCMSAAAQLRVGSVYTSSDVGSETEFPRLRVVLAPADPTVRLQPSDLILVEDGHDQNHAVDVRSFESTGYPLAAAVVLDVSGSMAGKPLEIVRRSLVKFVNDARPKDRIAVMTIADDARWDAPFGADHDTVRQQIAAIKPRGHLTRIYDGLLQAIGDFSPALPQRRELSLISDGHDEGSRATLEQVVELARTRGISIDAIGVTRSHRAYLQNLAKMAEQTGGSYREAESDAALEALVANGISNLKATPVASFDCAKISPDGQRHQLAVRWNKSSVLSNTASFTAPTHAAHPAQYFVRHVPVRTWVAVGGAVVLLLVGIVLAVVLLSRKKKSQGSAYTPPPVFGVPPQAEQAPPPVHSPTVDLPSPHLPTLGIDPAPVVAPFEPRPVPVQAVAPQPVAPAAPIAPIAPVGPRKTVLGGIFPAQAGSLGRLEAEAGLLAGRSFEIAREAVLQGGFWIGATPGCAVEIADDPTVSGYHAYLVYEEPILILVDNQSTNGTRLNGELLRGQSRPLKPQDRIQIGRTLFRIVT
jgi:Mg-chelatase subunit ChlD